MGQQKHKQSGKKTMPEEMEKLYKKANKLLESRVQFVNNISYDKSLLTVLSLRGRTKINENMSKIYIEEILGELHEYQLQQQKLINELGHEVKERIQIEKSLRESETRQKIALKSANIGPWDWNLSTNKVYFSPEWKSQIGYKDEEVTSTYETWESRLHPDDKQLVLTSLTDYLEGRRSDYRVEFRLQHKDGNYRWIFSQGEVLRDTKGQPYRMLGCHVDISERKEAIAGLARSEEKYRTLYTTSRDAIMTLAPPVWKFNSGNPATIKMFRCSSEEDFMSRKPHELSPEYQPCGMPSSQKALLMINKAMETGSHYFDWTHKRADGEEFYASVLLTRLTLENKQQLTATVRDISKQKELEYQLQKIQNPDKSS